MAAAEKVYYDNHLVNYSSSSGYPTIWDGFRNILLHRYVWEKYNGKIPKGYVVHHKDENKFNWNIDNLILLKSSEHLRYHALKNELGKSNKGKIKKHSSGYCKGATPVVLVNDNESIKFESVTAAARFLNVKYTSDVSRVLTGKRKTIKGWRCYYSERESI